MRLTRPRNGAAASQPQSGVACRAAQLRLQPTPLRCAPGLRPAASGGLRLSGRAAPLCRENLMVTSKQFYQEFRSVLAPLMEADGFKRMSRGRLGWTKPCVTEQLFLWFQCNKWGWDAVWGSTFTLEFQIVPEAGDEMTFKGRRERIGYLLEGFQELDELRLMNNAIIERLPGTVRNQAVTALDDTGKTHALEGFLIDPEPAVYGYDVWLNYYSLEDVRSWAAYFEKKLLYFIAVFVEQRKSPQGRARERFNTTLGQVQDATDYAEKIRLMKFYVEHETNAHYRAVAERWLTDANNIRPNGA